MKDDNQFIKSVYNKYLASSIFGILCSVAGQIANSVIVGNVLGAQALGVLSLMLPIYYIFATVGNLLGIGATALASSLTGQGEHGRSRRAFTSSYLLTAALAVVLTALVLAFLPQLVRVVGTPQELYQQTYDYCVIMAIGGIFTMGVYLAFNFLRLDGKAGASMLVFAIMAVVNVLLDLLLAGVLQMGIIGVSIATAAGAAAASLMGAVLLFKKSRNFSFVMPEWKEFWRLAGEMVKLGSPGAVENICILFRSLFLNRLILTGFGTLALSAFSVIGSLNSFALAIIAGTAGTIVPFVGVFSAERDTKSIRQVLQLALVQGLAMTAVFTVACMVFSGGIARAFGMGGGDTLELAKSAIFLFSISFIPALVGNILTSLHLSNGHTAIANVITLLRQFVLVAVFAVLLSNWFGLNGIWNGFWVAELVTLLIVAVIHLVCGKKSETISNWTLLDETAERNGHYISFSVENSVQAIMESVEKITAFCEANELQPKRAMLISLSLEEMLTSIREHSLGADEKLTMNVRILLVQGTIVLRIRNGGAEFNPVAYYEQLKVNVVEDNIDAMLALDDSLGIKMICDTADVVDYRRTFGVNNLSIII